MVGLICKQGGGDDNVDTVIQGGIISINIDCGEYYYVLMAMLTLGQLWIIEKASDSV